MGSSRGGYVKTQTTVDFFTHTVGTVKLDYTGVRRVCKVIFSACVLSDRACVMLIKIRRRLGAGDQSRLRNDAQPEEIHSCVASKTVYITLLSERCVNITIS